MKTNKKEKQKENKTVKIIKTIGKIAIQILTLFLYRGKK